MRSLALKMRMRMGPIAVLCALMTSLTLFCDASHFRGGVIMLQPTPGGEGKDMEVYFRISWRRSSGDGGNCNSHTVQNRLLIGSDSGHLTCQLGCIGTISDMGYRCTDFSVTENWSYGESRLNYKFDDSVDNMRIGFSGSAWIAPFNSAWNIATTMSMRRRNDTGRINSTPRAITSPVVRLQAGCNHTITIPVSDPDGDVMRCRWATGLVECGGVCNKFAESVLDPATCSLYYAVNPNVGYRAVALMIEDFASMNDTTPLSSVALQFLVLLYSSDETCSRAPEFVYPTYPTGACIAVPPGDSLQEEVTASSGGTGITITEFETVSPAGFQKSSLSQTGMRDQYTMRVSWLPELQQQNQTHGFCITAVNSAGLSSEQNCIQIMAGSFPPSIVNGSNVPNGRLLHPLNTLFRMVFDRDVQHGTHPSWITFSETLTKQAVHAIVVKPASTEVDFLNSKELEIRPQYAFAEDTSYYITFQAGIVAGMEGCHPWNRPLTDSEFWTFKTKDITPPFIEFSRSLFRMNGTAEITWVTNEETQCSCFLDRGPTQNCSLNIWRARILREGYHELYVDCGDAAGNNRSVLQRFHVDLTPPRVMLSRYPPRISREMRSIFSWTCDDPEGCAFFCSVVTGMINDSSEITFSPCGLSYDTGDLDKDKRYTFFVFAIDDVLNRGAPLKYLWTVDMTSPSLSEVKDTAILCDTHPQPEITGRPVAVDNLDPAPTVTYGDSRTDCAILRTWRVQDEAGNSDTHVQRIQLNYRLTLFVLPEISVACDSASGAVNVPEATATAGNSCQRPLKLTHKDTVEEPRCPSHLTRIWTLVDQCIQENITRSQTINLYDVCPSAACGRNESSPHGICSAGVCICNRPWYGTQCDVLVYSPLIRKVPDQEIEEGINYAFAPSILQATPPISWRLVAGPGRSTLDQVTGELAWRRTFAGSYTVIIEVQNEVGKDTVSWFLYVRTTYRAYLNVVPTKVYSKAEPVQLSGYVSYDDKSEIRDLLAGYVPVNIDVKCRGTTRTLPTYTQQDGTFSATFFPSSSEYGHYQAGARHPDTHSFDIQAEWKVMGMKFTPNKVRLRDDTLGFYQRTFHNVTHLVNDGPVPLHQIHMLPLPDQFQGQLNVSLAFSNGITLDMSNTSTSSPISLYVTSNGPTYVIFPIRILTIEMVSVYLTVDLQIGEILPVFVVQPQKIEAKLIRGEQRTLELNITNIGRISATNVQLTIPASNVTKLASFGTQMETGNGLTLQGGQSAIAVMVAHVPISHLLGEISGSLAITSNETSIEVPLKLIVSSDLLLDFTIIVEDEYTYFAEGKPLVDDATVRLTNYQNNIHLSRSTSEDNGTVTFEGITEDRYEMHVNAPQHLSLKTIIVTSVEQRQLTIFLERQAVKYTWSVKPVQVEDKYQVTLEADFQANVPMPVVTVTPREVDLDDVKLGIVDTIEFNITNHGLIRAEKIQFELPTGHSFLEFVLPFDPPQHLDAKTWMVIPVKTVRKSRNKRSLLTLLYLFKISYSFLCGDWKVRTVPVIFKERVEDHEHGEVVTRSIQWRHELGGEGCKGCRPFEIAIDYYTSSTINFCDKCIGALVGCIPNPVFPFSSCIPLIASGKIPSNNLDILEWLSCPSSKSHWPVCLMNLYRHCLLDSGDRRRRRRSLADTVKAYTETLYPVHMSVLYGVEMLGSDKWLQVDDPDWTNNVLKPVFDDASDMGQAISIAEYRAVMDSPFPRTVNRSDVSQLLQRINNTLYNWKHGKLEPKNDGENYASFALAEGLKKKVLKYDNKAKAKGFRNFLEAFHFAANDIKKVQNWEEEGGVCAVVRIRIEQEMALTREGFVAKLEIENKEMSSLEKLNVAISIVNSETGVEAKSLFSIGDAELRGALTGASGDGSLPSDLSGSVEWLMIPYSEAAPTEDQLYDVGGKLYYSVDAENIEMPLLPGQITVRPDPSLRVHYFWEKNVISDDPFTDEIEPSVPFTLAVAIRNDGYGTAHGLQITSAQPEIIENKKGLLISFEIKGATVGNQPITPSLKVQFGDLRPKQTKVARWILECSLMGEFKNYNATFENINPLGDPKLSLLDELVIHELVRNVKIVEVAGNEMLSDETDDVLDFLVNDRYDHHVVPDALYSSKTLKRFSVVEGNTTHVEQLRIGSSDVLLFQVFANTSGWNYFRSQEGVTGLPSDYVGSVRMLTKETLTGQVQDLPPDNAWISVDVLRRQREKDAHFVDFIAEYEVSDMLEYKLWFGGAEDAVKEDGVKMTQWATPIVTTTEAAPKETTEEELTTVKITTLGATPIATATAAAPKETTRGKPNAAKITKQGVTPIATTNAPPPQETTAEELNAVKITTQSATPIATTTATVPNEATTEKVHKLTPTTTSSKTDTAPKTTRKRRLTLCDLIRHRC